MPLLDKSCFSHLFESLNGKTLGFISLSGNVGDLMIQRATHELFEKFDIQYRNISESELESELMIDQVDEIVVSGGGNMGTLWRLPYKQRRKALQLGLPVTIFPQSFTRDDEITACYKQVFVRETGSQMYSDDFILGPDMALGMEIQQSYKAPVVETGLFLRKDLESCLVHNPAALVDPILISKKIEEYLSLASMFEHIITDRLHFAIAGLMVGRKVSLLPNAYHKNRSMYDTWLSGLGCNWLGNADSVSYDREQVVSLLWKRLGAAPSERFDWSYKPGPDPGFRTEALIDIEKYLSECDSYDQVEIREPRIFNSLCDANRSIEDMVLLLSSYFPEHRVSAAIDIQTELNNIASY